MRNAREFACELSVLRTSKVSAVYIGKLYSIIVKKTMNLKCQLYKSYDSLLIIKAPKRQNITVSELCI
jgi:hypothetical protein